MAYTTKQFIDSFPKYKLKRSTFSLRLFYRPLSYPLSAIIANLGVTANAVSYASAIVALAASIMFIINNYAFHIVGAVLVNLWLLMDCIDGNIARTVKKQPFGEFADAISGYILLGLVYTSIGYAAYCDGGIFITPGTGWIILIGALASGLNSLMRLNYQKYKNVEKDLIDNVTIAPKFDAWKDNEKKSSLIFRRLINELDISGFMPIAILLASIFHALDLIVIYSCLFYGISFTVGTLACVFKAVRSGNS